MLFAPLSFYNAKPMPKIYFGIKIFQEQDLAGILFFPLWFSWENQNKTIEKKRKNRKIPGKLFS